MVTKEEKINAVLSKIQDELLKFSKTKPYKSYLKSALVNMMKFLPAGKYIVVLNKAAQNIFTKIELKQLNKASSVSLTISQEENLETHGILLKSEDQKIVLEDTLEKRFEGKREELRSKINKILFRS